MVNNFLGYSIYINTNGGKTKLDIYNIGHNQKGHQVTYVIWVEDFRHIVFYMKKMYYNNTYIGNDDVQTIPNYQPTPIQCAPVI